MISKKAFFYFFGITMTLPFNFFITPHAYWSAKLADPSDFPTNRTGLIPVALNEYQIFWYSSLSVVMFAMDFVASFCGKFVAEKYPRKIRFVGLYSG